jgi:putative transposase
MGRRRAVAASNASCIITASGHERHGGFGCAPRTAITNQVWLADITYVPTGEGPTGEGWLYLAVVLDLFTRKIVGWAMRDHMRAELTIAALTMAIQRPPPGLTHHSDRGRQYAAAGYRKVHDAAGMIQSMSRKGNCWDKAL